MAYDIIGTVHKIGTVTTIPTRSGSALERRSITIMQQRYDQNTGEPYEPNFPTIDFTNKGCRALDQFKQGDRVRIRFDISGSRYNDKNTGEEKYFTSLRGFRIEPYVQQQPVAQQYPPQGGYPPQRPYQGHPAYQPQQPQQPFPPQQPPQNTDPNSGLPF